MKGLPTMRYYEVRLLTDPNDLEGEYYILPDEDGEELRGRDKQELLAQIPDDVANLVLATIDVSYEKVGT